MLSFNILIFYTGNYYYSINIYSLLHKVKIQFNDLK